MRHGPSGRDLPAMVAAVTDGATGAPMSIHRTFLAPDGAAKADIANAKMALGPTAGGAVRLAAAPAERNRLLIGEGIETTLAAMQATGAPGWAALSTSCLRTLELPSGVRNIMVLADNDANGAGIAAATAAARRWQAEGRRVSVALPPATGTDFADMLASDPSGATIREAFAHSTTPDSAPDPAEPAHRTKAAEERRKA